MLGRSWHLKLVPIGMWVVRVAKMGKKRIRGQRCSSSGSTCLVFVRFWISSLAPCISILEPSALNMSIKSRKEEFEKLFKLPTTVLTLMLSECGLPPSRAHSCSSLISQFMHKLCSLVLLMAATLRSFPGTAQASSMLGMDSPVSYLHSVFSKQVSTGLSTVEWRITASNLP